MGKESSVFNLDPESIKTTTLMELGLGEFEELLSEQGINNVKVQYAFNEDFYPFLAETSPESAEDKEYSLVACVGGIYRSQYVKTAMAYYGYPLSAGEVDLSKPVSGLSFEQLCSNYFERGNITIDNDGRLFINGYPNPVDNLILCTKASDAETLSRFLSCIFDLRIHNYPNIEKLKLRIILVFGDEHESKLELNKVLPDDFYGKAEPTKDNSI
jgi:hypothetical protein